MNSIKRVNEAEWSAVLHILTSCAKWLSDKGMNHWKNAHNEARVKERIRSKEVFLIYEKDSSVGTITLSQKSPSYYNEEDRRFWESPESPAVYISGLAVLPSHQKRGLAGQLLNFAESIAKDRQIPYVRFDAVAHYTDLTAFYKRRGYKIVGKRLTLDVESNFFEKRLE